jgi:20S proteasome subunit alpha 2
VNPASVQKINNLTDNIGVVYSGLPPDSRVLVTKGRKQAQQYSQTYKEPIPVSQIAKKIAAIMQEYTQSG